MHYRLTESHRMPSFQKAKWHKFSFLFFYIATEAIFRLAERTLMLFVVPYTLVKSFR